MRHIALKRGAVGHKWQEHTAHAGRSWRSSTNARTSTRSRKVHRVTHLLHPKWSRDLGARVCRASAPAEVTRHRSRLAAQSRPLAAMRSPAPSALASIDSNLSQTLNAAARSRPLLGRPAPDGRARPHVENRGRAPHHVLHGVRASHRECWPVGTVMDAGGRR